MAASFLVEIATHDLDDFARDMHRMADELPRAMRTLHEVAANDLQRDARGEAEGYPGVTPKAAGNIAARITAHDDDHTTVTVTASGDLVGVGLWGANERTGWNARNLDSQPQHPSWRDDSWDPGGAGGPRGIGEAFRAEVERLDGRYDDMLAHLGHQAGFH